MSKGDKNEIGEIFAEGVKHDQLLEGCLAGREGARKLVNSWRAAFPYIHEDTMELIADGDRFANRFRLRGAQQLELHGIPGADRKVDTFGAEVPGFENGNVVDHIRHEAAHGLSSARRLAAPSLGECRC